MSIGPGEMQEIFRHTRIIRKPTYGIIKGYHELPYICLGTGLEDGHGTLRVTGKIHVSPQMILRPNNYMPKYGEIFGEDATDTQLQGRIFGFLGFPGKPVDCKSETLEVNTVPVALEEVLSKKLDELERYEDITTGVIITPNARYYQISIERFISSILQDEFSF